MILNPINNHESKVKFVGKRFFIFKVVIFDNVLKQGHKALPSVRTSELKKMTQNSSEMVLLLIITLVVV